MSDTQTLQYRIDGPDDGPVLVLGPSLGTTWHMWDRQIPELSRRWRVLRFDLPGHGGAPAHPAPSVPVLADRLLATLDQLGVRRFGYAGCSIGGAIGMELALRHGGPLGGAGDTSFAERRDDDADRLLSLALISSSARSGTADAWRQRGVVVRTNGLDPVARSAPERWFTPAFAAAQSAIVEWAVQMVRTTDPGCYIAGCEALAAFDSRAHLGDIEVPTLVLVGADDHVAPPADARALVAGIPDARLALVPAASHLAPVEQPTAVTDLLVRHFDGPGGIVHRPTAGPRAAGDQPTAGTPLAPPAAPSLAPPPSRPPLVPATYGPRSANSEPRAQDPPQPPPAVQPTAEAGHRPEAPVGRPVAEITSAGPRPASPDGHDAVRDQGVRARREVLGDAYVDQVEAARDDFTADFDDFVTRYEWGEVWSRTGLDRRSRSISTLTALAARGHAAGVARHTRAALRNGLTPDEIKEILLHTAVYCGVAVTDDAFAAAQRVIREETSPEESLHAERRDPGGADRHDPDGQVARTP